MKLSSGKLQFGEWKTPAVDAGTFCTSLILVFFIVNSIILLLSVHKVECLKGCGNRGLGVRARSCYLKGGSSILPLRMIFLFSQFKSPENSGIRINVGKLRALR
jgi:hypothetical protein